MPCSQMMSMNIRPPRATADRKVDSVPKVKARMRKSGRRNIGSATRRSTSTKATRLIAAPAAPPDRMPAGRAYPVGDRDHDQDEPDGEGQVAGPVDPRAARGAQLAQ